MNIRSEFKQIFFICGPLLNLLSQGLVTGFPSTLIPALTANDTDLPVGPHHVQLIITLPIIISILSVIGLSPLMHIYGRKIAHIILSITLAIGWLLTSMSTSPTILLIGLSFAGLSNGGIFFIATCISELSNPYIRGILLSCKGTFICAGILISHLLGFNLTWRETAMIAAVPSILALIITLFWYETPDWYVSKGRYSKAEEVFYKIRGRCKKYEIEIAGTIQVDIDRRKSRQNKRKTVLESLKCVFCKTFLRPMMLLFCAVCCVEFSGRRAFTVFAVQITESIIGNSSKYTLILVLDSIMLFCASISIFFVKTIKRRKLFIYGGFASVFSLVACSLLLYLKTFIASSVLNWITTMLLCIYYCLFNCALIPVSSCVIGELMPLELRPIGAICDGILISTLGSLTVFLVPHLQDRFGVYGLFLIYAVFLSLALAYIACDMPETKDRTLNDITEYFRGKSSKVKDLESVEFIEQY